MVLAQTIILALTLIALVVYTHYTRKIQKAMIKQTTVTLLPVFLVHIGEIQKAGGGAHSFDLMELENIGNGVALNVRVDTIDIRWKDLAVEEVWPTPKIVLNGVMAINPKGRVTMNHQSTIGPNGKSPGDRFDWVDKLLSRADFDYQIRIRFSDVLGNRYVQTIHTGVSGIWPDTVSEDSKRTTTSVREFEDNRFINSPLKFLRRR
jgi:hypothetical protein